MAETRRPNGVTGAGAGNLSGAILLTLAGIFSLGCGMVMAMPQESAGVGAAVADIEVLEAVAPDSPRASLARYLELCRSGDYEKAANYLRLRESEKPRRAELARRLKAVLDNYIWFDLELISPRSEGETEDQLPPRG